MSHWAASLDGHAIMGGHFQMEKKSAAAVEPPDLFLPANTARHHVGIRSNRR
jgi:hypothetical protein